MLDQQLICPQFASLHPDFRHRAHDNSGTLARYLGFCESNTSSLLRQFDPSPISKVVTWRLLFFPFFDKDSPLSLAFLESDEGKKAIIALHVEGITDFINQRANEPL